MKNRYLLLTEAEACQACDPRDLFLLKEKNLHEKKNLETGSGIQNTRLEISAGAPMVLYSLFTN